MNPDLTPIPAHEYPAVSEMASPEILPPAFSTPSFQTQHEPPFSPGLLNTLLFLLIAGGVTILIQTAAVVLTLHFHLFRDNSIEHLQHETLLIVPSQALAYLVSIGLSALVFRRLWRIPFSTGIQWNLPTALRRSLTLVPLGIAVGFFIQWSSNFLPIPKDLPIDQMFQTSSSAWLIAIFGVTLAPAFEEIAFRGFLYPALTRWTTKVFSPRIAVLFAAILTSLPFALLHGQQLAFSWAPLLLLFSVSMILCYIRTCTDSVAASTLVHAAYNLSDFASMFYLSGGFRHLDQLK